MACVLRGRKMNTSPKTTMTCLVALIILMTPPLIVPHTTVTPIIRLQTPPMPLHLPLPVNSALNKGEHKSGSPTSTCGFICGKPTGQVTTDLSFQVAQVFADLGSTSVEAGTCHRYPPYLSLNLVEIYKQNVIKKVNQKKAHSEPDYLYTYTGHSSMPCCWPIETLLE